MSTPEQGKFTLHARAVPKLKAGDYRITGTQQIAGGEIEPYDQELRISSPRYTMPPDQVLSTFPPANAQGAFEHRLPQIVLKRRTLPWDRRAGDGEPDAMPWLALVVIAEGEGQLSGETPVAQCVTPGVELSGEVDVPTSVYLGVSRTVVKAVFPTKAEVPLLAHVRQVDPSDTELGLGDDDGFLAVVMANRLPQHRRSTPDDPGGPVRYLACLVNLEKQLDVLPEREEPVLKFDAHLEVLDLGALAVATDTDHYVMGGYGPEPGPKAQGGKGPKTVPQAAKTGPTPKTASAAAWVTAPDKVAEVAVSASAEEAGRLVRDTMGLGFRYNVEHLVPYEKTYRFPVLAHWSFTATGGGSFETLMQNLDVGLLGTTAPAPRTDRPAAELTDTGHVGLPHLTRRGESTRAWYRGPFTPRPAGVDPAKPHVRLPLAHTSDQLRRVTPDGREDLSLAAAFEIGRLLALSQPSAVAAQLRWRRERFGSARAREFAAAAVEGLDSYGLQVASDDLGRLLGKAITKALAADPETVLGPGRPLADAGRPLDLQGDVDELLTDGFGIPLAAVKAATGPLDLLVALRTTQVPLVAKDFDAADALALRAGLTDQVARLFQGVLSEGGQV
ncbi:hypothetical protein [Saccharothrix stipae]